jgi:hypothetical protein
MNKDPIPKKIKHAGTNPIAEQPCIQKGPNGDDNGGHVPIPKEPPRIRRENMI